jgi:glycine dehydrogenase
LNDYSGFVTKAKAVGAVAICATDLLALTILPNPASVGFDIAIGMLPSRDFTLKMKMSSI